MSEPTLTHLTQQVVRFREERDWKQFHNPKELAIAVSVEANELLALMQWRSGSELEAALQSKEMAVREELADVLGALLLLAHDLDIDLAAALAEKLTKNAQKYPVEKARGRNRKYNEL